MKVKGRIDLKEIEIDHLPKEEWKDTILPIGYVTKHYYDLEQQANGCDYQMTLKLRNLDEPMIKRPSDYDYPDKLYQDHYENAYAWGVFEEGQLIAAIETSPELWSNRLRITELWVDDKYQKQGIGHRLLEMAREQARRERRRAIILETQSCNVNAIGFYQHEGFELIGFDACCYSNDDIARKEVRLEFGILMNKKKKLKKSEINIRHENPEDYHGVEWMTQKAFWNKHHLGCDEHYLVHKLRNDPSYLPDISLIAEKDGEVIGAIMYSVAEVRNDERVSQVLIFGPLCVDPVWQGCGVGELLFKESVELARKAGYPGIIIYGEPDYYPRLGFQTCDHFNITTADGKNFDAFMGYEIIKDGFKDIQGSFHYSHVFEELPPDEVEAFNLEFPPLMKMRFPGQWD